MFSELPSHIQQQIVAFLQANNFLAAKQLRDQYLDEMLVASES